jgi:hypothetical protein
MARHGIVASSAAGTASLNALERREWDAAADERTRVLDAMVRWSEGFIEQPHPRFGDLPICPFAKAARLRQTIRFEVLAFDVTDPFEPRGGVMCLIDEFRREAGRETLFVVHPDPRRISARGLEELVARLNARLAEDATTADLQVFEAHPDSDFCVGGVYTRRSPYPSFQVLSRHLLKTASDSLRGSGYYDQFTPTMLRAVGMPR